MEKVHVDLGKRSYDILIGQNTLDNLGNYLPKKYTKILVISNDTVGALYLDRVIAALEKMAGEVSYYEVKDGEEYKSIDTVLPIYDFMVEKNLDRSSLVVSLGGGVICDMTGYVAATYMRGIDFVQIPTTLLAQVDASIGGKVAVNHKNGKNLIGAFYQPKMVFIDVAVLKTLDNREIKTGLAEVIKHGVIADSEYFRYTEENAEKILALDMDVLINIVKRSCEIKAKVVSEDEEEKGIRAILNYGHTFGHVVESLTKYKVYRHGEAVAAGMMFEAWLAKELGVSGIDVIEEQAKIFERFGIDSLIPKYSIEKFFEILKHDKKVKDGKMVFILCPEVGRAEILKVDEDKIEKLYKKIDGKEVKGVIDIGTNTIRMLIGENYKGKIINKYAKSMEITRLGEDVDKTKKLSKEAISRTVDALKYFKKEASEYGVLSLEAIATSAARDAENGDDFTKQVKADTGIDVTIVQGEQEGTFAFNGVMTDNFSGNALVVDIGGGSTEFIFGDINGVKSLKSIDIGTVRLKEKFFSDDKYEKNLKKAKKHVENMLNEIKNETNGSFELIGVAGTVTTQVSVIKKMGKYDSSHIHKYILTKKEIEKNLKKYMSKTLDERKKIKGLPAKRADVIIAGTYLLLWILEFFGKESIIVSDNDILEGLLIK